MNDSSKLGPESKVVVGGSVYVRSFGREIVLLDFGRGEYFGLDEVGAEVWRGIERGDSLGRITDRVVEIFDVAREQALEDIVAIVSDLVENRLVHP